MWWCSKHVLPCDLKHGRSSCVNWLKLRLAQQHADNMLQWTGHNRQQRGAPQVVKECTSTPERGVLGACCLLTCVQVDSVNLAGLDRVLVVYAAGSSDRSVLIRQYRIAFKKSGTKVRMLPISALGQQPASSTTFQQWLGVHVLQVWDQPQ